MQGLSVDTAATPYAHHWWFDPTFDTGVLRQVGRHKRSNGQRWISTPVFARKLSPQRTQHLERIQWLNHCNR